ncbi:DUF4942 domain-containing protein [Olivibacter sp. 47]|uniref:DUF4942 domain-containing protein n=1 Tax=Olivibacter sp. 47 TaxID=3056486 RepID=UPI0025A3728A|nr:DUF4942 domain-containing protein [Olivibacter sp. 47]MDM8174768.1 DUF4942 domain-containing protein [Olivibacter sp. 47]
MFNKDFFPTPKEVVDIMLRHVDLRGKTVLEPSAGKGDIIDVLKERGANVICCELNEDLAVIAGNKAKLIAKDFLTVTSEQISHVDYIIMNPPFSADDQHINHAWDIAPDGCEIIALCNWQSIENDYSRSRRILKSTIDTYGNVVNLGDVFQTAERSTGVEIGFIRLVKPGSSNDFADFFTDEEDDIEKQENGLMSYNAVREVVQRYVNAVKLYDDVLENAVKMNSLTDGLGVKDLVFTCSQKDVPLSRSEFAKELQKKSWSWVINKMNLDKYSTRGLMQDINKFVEQQKSMKFTMKNIYLMLDAIVQTAGQRMDKAMIEVFDNLTRHYHENRWNLEGWKTNSHYLVNRKFIMPYIAPETKWFGIEVNDRQAEIVDDFNKALCYLTGHSWNNEDRFAYCVRKNNVTHGEWFDWGFFDVKLFKKGTGHFKFKDENVWALFNQQIARIKGFPLPENLKKAA